MKATFAFKDKMKEGLLLSSIEVEIRKDGSLVISMKDEDDKPSRIDTRELSKKEALLSFEIKEEA